MFVSGYDGGDCCECTCISTTDNGCGVATGFACFDPSASSSCVIEAGEGNTAGITGDDDTERIILLPDDGRTEQSLAPTWAPTPTAEGLAATPSGGYSTASSSSSCILDSLSDGSCNADNNNQECGASRSMLVLLGVRSRGGVPHCGRTPNPRSSDIQAENRSEFPPACWSTNVKFLRGVRSLPRMSNFVKFMSWDNTSC